MGPGGAVLPGPRAGPVRTRCPMARLQGRAPATWPCAATPTPGPRSSAWWTQTTSSGPSTYAYRPLISPTPTWASQTCESNRNYEGSAVNTAASILQGLYMAVMSSRNERDSVPFVGTMGLFRRSALEGSGGLERVVHQRGHRGLGAGAQGGLVRGYTCPAASAGASSRPPTPGFNTQRYRWCFGAMQILRLHWRSFMPWDK